VKTDWRNRLNELNLTDLLRIKVTGPNIKEFNEEFCDVAIILSNDAKRRANQTKRKAYKERSNGGKQTRAMERN
jgi:imidazole glycerol phosphate synthase subunit HisF